MIGPRPLTFPKGVASAGGAAVLGCDLFGTGGAAGVIFGYAMTTLIRPQTAREPVPDHEQRRVALTYLQEAWAEARIDGIDDDCMAQACLFAAFIELVTTYGEDATAKYAESLVTRINNGEFSLDMARQ